MDQFTILIGPTGNSILVEPSVIAEFPSKPDSSMGCFVILFRDTRMDKGMMFKEDPWSTIACFRLTFAIIFALQWPVVVARQILLSFAKKNITLSLNLLPSHDLLSTRTGSFPPSYGLVSPKMGLVLAKCWSTLESIWLQKFLNLNKLCTY